jgi:two-component system NtrC family sensor kinase
MRPGVHVTSFRNKLISQPIRIKLFYLYSLAFLLYIVFGNLLVYSILSRTIESNIEEQLKNNTAAILKLVRTSADTAIRNYLRAVAEKNYELVDHYYNLARIGELTTEQAKLEASKTLLHQSIATTGYLYAINSDGIIQVHPKPLLIGRDLSDNHFIQLQKERKQGYIEYDWANPGESTPRPKALYMIYFAPWDWIISASSYRDEFRDLIDVSDFRDSILNTVFGKTGYPYVMDSTGLLIIHPALENTNIYESTDANGRQFIKEICERKNGRIIYPWQNPGEPEPRKKLVLFNYIPELDWIVASSSYLEEFYAPLQTITYSSLLLGGVLILFLLPLTWFMSSSITRPLKRLIGAFQEGAKGDLTNRMPLRPNPGKDELELLANYYNAFMDKLEASRKKLIESEEKHRNIVDNAVQGVFQSSLDGRLLQANPAMAKLFGYLSPEDFLTNIQSAEKIYVDSSDRKRLLEILEERGSTTGFDVRFKRKNGDVFWGAVIARALRDKEGRLIAVEGMLHDITEQQQTRLALTKAKEQAEAASRLKSDFLSLISHEMRTPLTSVIGYAKLAERKMIKTLERLKQIDPNLFDGKEIRDLDQVQESFSVISEQGQRLSDLLKDIFDLAQLEKDEAELDMQVFDMNELIEELIPKVQAILKETPLDFEYDVAPVRSPVRGVRNSIKHVLIKMVDNAVKFTEAGQVVLRTNQVRGFIEVEIQDTGPGIPTEYQDQLYEPFFQVGEILTDKPHGSGLGLTICQKIVEMHAGCIRLVSKPGQGSTFIVAIPLHTQTSVDA